MDGQDYYHLDHSFYENHHRELLKVVEEERLVRGTAERSPSRLDHLLDWSGDLLISLGQRLKSRTTTPDLSGDCV